MLALAALSLLAGLWGGLLRMSWRIPLLTEHANWITWHGPLLAVGFFGTLISIERAAALRAWWGWLAPLLTGTGAIVVAAGSLDTTGPILAIGGAALFLAVTIRLGCRRPDEAFWLMALGAAAWLAGVALWAGRWPVARLVLFWICFFVLTIAAERLELARLRPRTRASAWHFRSALALLVAGLAPVAFGADGAGQRLSAAGVVLLAVWLFRHDLARSTVRGTGVARFSAVALLASYAWLALGGALVFANAPLDRGLGYDAAVHALMVGFVFGMVFGHAPVILPAVLGRRGVFRRHLYAPLALLHGSLLLRVGSDLAGWHDGRQWGGMLGAIAIATFLPAVTTTLSPGR